MQIFDRLWRLFSSIKLAIALILLLTVLGLVGIFTSADLFSEWYFTIPGGLLMANIIICSLNRWKTIRKSISGGRLKQSEGFFEGEDKTARIEDYPLPPAQVAVALEQTLHKHHYRVRTEKDTSDAYLAADKNRYCRLGTYLSHLSIVLLVLAYIIGSALGFQDTGLIISEGYMRQVGHDTGLSLQLLDFTDEYYDDGTPSDYRSEVVLYKDGQEVVRTTIRVNHPLSYEGVRFYQAFFGPVVGLQATRDGEVIALASVPLYNTFESYGYYRDAGYTSLEELGLSFVIISSAYNAADPMIPYGSLGVLVYQDGQEIGLNLLTKDTPLEVAGIEVAYIYDAQYSGFQVRSDPGNTLVWVACSLFIVGLIMVFYFPQRRVWALIKQPAPGRSRLYIRWMSPRAADGAQELETLLADAIDSLGGDIKKEKGTS
jgi:cytochrome c biogenesis protein